MRSLFQFQQQWENGGKPADESAYRSTYRRKMSSSVLLDPPAAFTSRPLCKKASALRLYKYIINLGVISLSELAVVVLGFFLIK